MIGEVFDILFEKASQGSCMYRKYAAAIVYNNKVIGVGYARTVTGEKCANCPRMEKMRKYGEISEFFEVCRVIHAEISAILNCKTSPKGASLYLLGINEIGDVYKGAFPCDNCLKVIQYVGISKIYVFKERDSVISYEVKI